VIGQLKNHLVKLIEALMEISILSFLLSLAFKEIFITFKKKLKERFIKTKYHFIYLSFKQTS
jgi:hypothetical protein